MPSAVFPGENFPSSPPRTRRGLLIDFDYAKKLKAKYVNSDGSYKDENHQNDIYEESAAQGHRTVRY